MVEGAGKVCRFHHSVCCDERLVFYEVSDSIVLDIKSQSQIRHDDCCDRYACRVLTWILA